VVGLVIVSHSRGLADGVVELARQMGGGEVAIEPAGGMADPEGAIGTDVGLVHAAIERVAGPDGVLVLMDLGSAVMSAEMAAEMIAAEGGTRVLLCEAPLVEGAVAAAARAGAGAPLDEVAAEARAALGMKAGLLGVEPDGGGAAQAPAPAAGGPVHEARLDVGIPLGIHARPAARLVAAVAPFDARVSVVDETTGRGPADARSLSALVTLGARNGHVLLARAQGPDADAALDALRALAAEGFGDAPGAAAGVEPVAVAASERAPAAAPAPAGPPAAGTVLRGVPVAPGIAIGPARRPVSAPSPPAGDEPAAGDPAAERARLDEARAATRGDVEAARSRIAAQAGDGEAAIFDAHLLLLGDPTLLEPAHRAIEEGAGAARGWRAAVDAAAAAYRGLDDAYLRERAADVEDVGNRVLRHLTGEALPAMATERGVLVVADLAPGDAARLDPGLVDGLAIAHGGATSHAAILARALGIPSVVGLGDAVLGIADGTPLVLDGGAGTVEVDPSPEQLAARERARAEAEARAQRARERAHAPARTRDGSTIEVAANIGTVADAAAAVELGADGVGLLRTEFLFLDRDEAPGESEQRAVYEAIATALDGRTLIVRTLDAGADKPLRFVPQAPEDNPFLGVRGIRFGLARPELLDAQLRAILALAGRFDVRVMFPMVATLAEYRAARTLLEAARAELGAPPIPVGIMVEVPAVAVAADRFAPEVDFFSIGTNDLAQYTMAAERGNEALAGLLAGPVPALLRLISAVADAAKANGRWVGVCGELAGDPAAAVLLAGLGVDELSMAAPLIPGVKETLRGVTLDQARDVAARALQLDDAGAVGRLVAPLLAASPAPDG
jgi:phosphoenolpyruvate-protein phosphotransferase/dihydroxyacetone kinase phosphotransfer subunit